MSTNFSRRTLIKGAAGAAAVVAASTTFFAPNLIAAQGSNVELKLWTSFGSGTNGEAQTKLIDDFNAQGTGVTVTSTAYANYEEIANAVLTGLDSGDVPHMGVFSDVWWFTFYLRSALKDLTDKVDAPDDYVESLYTEYQRNGGQWAVPFARSTPLLYINTDALEKAGLDETIFAKWSDFRENGLDLQSAGGVAGSFGFGNAASYGAWTMHGPVWAFDGHYSDADFKILMTSEETVAAGEFMREFVQSHGGLTVADPSTEFATGNLGATIQSTGSLGNITEGATINFKTAQLPEEVKFGCPTGGSGLGILSSVTDEEFDAAMSFLTFCTNTENAAAWSQKTGYMPVRTSAVESDAYKTFLADHPNNQVAIDQLPKTQPQDSARVFIPNGDQTIGRAWEQILVNNVPAADAFAEAQSTLEEDAKPVLDALKEIEG